MSHSLSDHATASQSFAQPLDIGGLRLRNRFVSAPMERNYCDFDGTMSDRYIAYLERRAAGGAALVFTEAAYVRADGKGRIRQMGVDEDERIPGIARLAEAVHAHGALLGVELNHGGRTAQGAVSGLVPVAPSPIPCHVVGGEMPEQLGSDDIEHIIECYGEAAARCQQAGVDVISLHGGHGYLIHQFLSPRTTSATTSGRIRRSSSTGDRVGPRACPEIVLGLRFLGVRGCRGWSDPETTRARIDAIDTDRLDSSTSRPATTRPDSGSSSRVSGKRGLLAPYSAQYTRDFDIPVGVAGRITSRTSRRGSSSPARPTS